MGSGFTLVHTHGHARAGVWNLAHGPVPTPAFMPVGTQASVKTLLPSEVAPLCQNMMLCNTYHLLIRPGVETIKQMGGLHRWMKWGGNILTDSGGFQLWSLAHRRKIEKDGVTFQSHLDGRKLHLNPRNVVDAQRGFGSDVMMVLDECTAYPATYEAAARSMELSMDWASQAQDYWMEVRSDSPSQLLGIVQGGMYSELRKASAAYLAELGMDGYAIGGLSVGEPKSEMQGMTALSAQSLPENKIRYLMGVGKPADLITSVAAGVDVFDCVLPTRNARNGGFFKASGGHGNIKNAIYRQAAGPLDESCGCRGCRTFSASYLHHLFKAGEIVAFRLLSEHNLWILKDLMSRIREAILENRFDTFQKDFWDQNMERKEENLCLN